MDSDGAHSVIYRHSDLDHSELGKSKTCGAVDRGSQRRMAAQQQQVSRAFICGLVLAVSH